MSAHPKVSPLLLMIALLPVTLVAQTPDVSGTWQSDSNTSIRWILDQKSGTIHVQQLTGDKVEVDFTCPLGGQECDVKLDGHPEKLMMYFNGDKLVQITEHGDNSEKKRFFLGSDGKTLTVETVPLSSGQKADTISFHRQATLNTR